jgi:hypothetical protein
MEPRGFFASLFDYSFSSYITPRIIKLLYVLATILVALWVLLLILLAFKASKTLGILTLLIGGPLDFLITMIWVRVGLEALSAFFRIHRDVHDINARGVSSNGLPVAPVPPPLVPEPKPEAALVGATAPAPAAAAPPPAVERFCANCGAETTPGKRFCTGCGEALS